MARRLAVGLALVGGMMVLGTTLSPGQAPAQRAILLNVSNGQLPPDTGLEGKTKPEIVANTELGGKALKVAFAPGDSFGARAGGNQNWKRFALFRFDAVNPASAAVDLELTIIHARSTNYPTRVVVPIQLKSGKNEVSVRIEGLTNVDGSTADLANVVRWYIFDLANKAPTVYFSDIWLGAAEAAPPAASGSTSAPPATRNPSAGEAAAPSRAGPPPLLGYRVKGKVGSMDIDLTLTPFVVSGPSAALPATAVPGDSTRRARIEAAKMPRLTRTVLFDTPEADTILSALEVFPPDNPWNLDVSAWPLHLNSKNIIASIGAAKPLRYSPDMGFVLVPPNQPKVDIKIVSYPGESDKGPFPVPANTPIEGWPLGYQQLRGPKKVTLEDVQRNILKEDGDRHALVLDPTNRMLYEFYQMRKTDSGWQASQASVFDLKSNRLRPEQWTSADAAGLPIFPAVVRYDELKRGLVEHAMRVTVVKTRREYVYPARHFASSSTDENLPRMGERLRLRPDFDVSGFSPEVQAILKGLKKYGMFVADNGLDWLIAVAPDSRIPVLHEELRKVKGSDFEVVQPPPGYQPPAE
jgi:hypothetical protein